jgi:hypothetical protein
MAARTVQTRWGMQVTNAREVFEAIASRARVPRLRNAVGSWEVQVTDVGTWSIKVDHGTLKVLEGSDPAATVRVRFSEAEFVRVARGDGHENLVTAGLRGAMTGFEGPISFAQKLTAIIPLADEDERSGS